MEAVCIAKSNSKEEFDAEEAELTRNLSIGSLSEAVEKVINWFEKNDEYSTFGDCLEALSLKSSNGSIVDDNESFNTPSILSEAEDLQKNYT